MSFGLDLLTRSIFSVSPARAEKGGPFCGEGSISSSTSSIRTFSSSCFGVDSKLGGLGVSYTFSADFCHSNSTLPLGPGLGLADGGTVFYFTGVCLLLQQSKQSKNPFFCFLSLCGAPYRSLRMPRPEVGAIGSCFFITDSLFLNYNLHD